MNKIDPIEVKVFIASVFATFVFDLELLLRFLIPLLSGIILWFVRLFLDEWKEKRSKRRKYEENE